MDKELMVEDVQTRAYTPRLIDKKAPTTRSGHERLGISSQKAANEKSGFVHKKTKHVGQA